jgi:hypothetical protein
MDRWILTQLLCPQQLATGLVIIQDEGGVSVVALSLSPAPNLLRWVVWWDRRGWSATVMASGCIDRCMIGWARWRPTLATVIEAPALVPKRWLGCAQAPRH